jgi:ligand-binding sensor domain-containing protein
MLDVDNSGQLWVGGFINDLASFNPATEQFTYYKASEKDSTTLISGHIQDLMVSQAVEGWVATQNGMSRLNPKTGKFTRYQPNPKEPKGDLKDHYVLSLYKAQEGIIWVGTFQGELNRFDHTLRI